MSVTVSVSYRIRDMEFCEANTEVKDSPKKGNIKPKPSLHVIQYLGMIWALRLQNLEQLNHSLFKPSKRPTTGSN